MMTNYTNWSTLMVRFLVFQVGRATYQITRLPCSLWIAQRVFNKLTRVLDTH